MSGLSILSIVLALVAAIPLIRLAWSHREWRIGTLAGLVVLVLAGEILDLSMGDFADSAADAGALTAPSGPLDWGLQDWPMLAFGLLALLAALALSRQAGGDEAAARQAARLRRLFDGLPAMVGYVGSDRRYRFVNRRMAECLGASQGTLVGRSIEETLGETGVAAARAHVDAALNGRDARFRTTLTVPGLGPRVLEIAYVPELDAGGRVRGFFILGLDVSEAQRAERALIESEQRFRDLADIASDWYWETDSDSRFTYISPRMQEVVGASASSFLGVRRRDLSGLECPSEAWEEHEADLREHRPFRNFVYARVLDDGRRRVFRISGKPVFGPDSVYQGYRGVGCDITDEVTLVERQAQAELRFARAIESVPEAFGLYDRDDRLVACNRVFRQFFEIPRGLDNALGMTFEEIVRGFAESGGVAGQAQEADTWLAARLDRRKAPAQRFRTRTADGRWLETTDFLLDDGSVITITSDVTRAEQGDRERRAHETELAQVQRRSIMGEMAAMLAHELNQPLSAVVNYTGGCLRRLSANRLGEEDFTTALERIGFEAGRASEMVRGISAFLGATEVAPEAIDVGRLFSAVEMLAGPELQAGQVIADYVVEPDLPPLRAVKIEVEQVLLNLIRNAIEAVQEVPVARRRIRLEASRPGPATLEISISDNGKGIPAEARAEAFNAFFTTKPGGLGMGLAICRRIAQGHGGNLQIVRAEPGDTTLCLSLPIDAESQGDDLRAA